MALIVNGEKIEDSLIQQEVERLRSHYEQVFADQGPEEREAQLLDWSRENVIERVLVNQEAKKDGQEIPQAEIESALAKVVEQCGGKEQFSKEISAEDAEKIREDIELQLKVERRLQDISNAVPKPSQADVRGFYEENKEQFKSVEKARVAHIVKYINWQTDEATAYSVIKKAQDELKNGAAFEALVDKYTDCADSGGDLGSVMRGQMVEEFEDVVFNLDAGEVSDVFRTRFGFHIAKVYHREPAVVPGLEEVKGRVVEALKKRMQEKAIEEFIDRLRSEAEIREI